MIDPDPFCTSCQISSMNKKSRSKIPLKPKAPFKWVFMDIIPSTAPKSLTSDTIFSNYLLIVDAYYNIPKLYGIENITTAEVMDKLDMFQSRFGKIDQFGWWDINDTTFSNYLLIVDAYYKIPKLYGMENITNAEVMDKLDMFQSRFRKMDQFGWWDLERILENAGTQFTSTEFKDECQTRGVCLTLAAPEDQDMNGQVEATWRTSRTVAHSLMVHARVPEVYVHFALMYTIDHIFPVLPIKDLINEDGDLTTPHKLATGTKPSVSHLRVLSCPCAVRKATSHVEKNTLNMRHQAKKGFRGIFVGIPEHQKGYLVYVPSTRKIM